MESLWPDVKVLSSEDNQAIEILREQAKAIRKETNGAIKATFSRVDYKKSFAGSLEQMSNIISTFSPAYEETMEQELQSKTDINELFAKKRYKFEIYNEEYRFRLFVVNYSEMYPISLEVDGGILESIAYINQSDINSNTQLIEVIKGIFNSTKVKNVIWKMMNCKNSSVV